MTNETKKQSGWMVRLLTAVCEKLAHWICMHEIEMSPTEAQMSMWQCGMGAEEARMMGMLRQWQPRNIE